MVVIVATKSPVGTRWTSAKSSTEVGSCP